MVTNGGKRLPPVSTVAKLVIISDMLPRLIFQSRLPPLIYKVVGVLRTSKEKEIASQMGKQKILGPY